MVLRWALWCRRLLASMVYLPVFPLCHCRASRLLRIGIYHVLLASYGAEKFGALVSQQLALIAIEHIDQSNESDLHLLTRLARQHGAVSKPVAGFLVFVFKGEAKSATGQQLPGFYGLVFTTFCLRHTVPRNLVLWYLN
jgi:hypothetical protein